jgi:hypothetical protein
MDKPFGVDLLRASKDQKPVRRCSEAASPLSAGYAGSPPAAGHGAKGARDASLRRLSASCPDAHDRHTATGTCNGRRATYSLWRPLARECCGTAHNFSACPALTEKDLFTSCQTAATQDRETPLPDNACRGAGAGPWESPRTGAAAALRVVADAYPPRCGVQGKGRQGCRRSVQPKTSELP